MLKHMINRIIILFFVMVIIFSSTADATKPVFDFVICSDTTRFNKGDDITFNLYLVGLGDITEDYLLFYVDNNMFVSNLTILGLELKNGLQDQGTNAQVYEGFMLDAKQGFPNHPPDKLNPLYAGIFDKNGTYIPPILIKITTNDNVSSGDHDFEVIYLYRNPDDGNWLEVSKTKTFHINTIVEQYEVLGFLWNFFQSFLGFGVALGIFALSIKHSKKKEETSKINLKNNLLLMLQDEIDYNLDKVKQMQREIPKKYDIPSYRLKTGNKDACWTKIVEFRSEEHDFIRNISVLYGKYDLLNRTIDIGAECLYHTAPTSGVSAEIIRVCKKIEEKTQEVGKII